MSSRILWADADSATAAVGNNPILRSNDWSQSVWTKEAGVTATYGVADPEGGLTASTITATTTATTGAYQNGGVSTAKIRTNRLWIRRRTGTGQVYVVDTTGANIPVTISSSYQRFTTVGASNTNRYVGVRLLTVGNAVDVWAAQVDEGEFAAADILTGATAMTGLGNAKVEPLDRFRGWTPTSHPVGPSRHALGTGQKYVFPFRRDHIASFTIAGIPMSLMDLMIRLQLHLEEGGTVEVHTGDAAFRKYVTCCLAPESRVQIRQNDSRMVEYDLMLTLLNVASSPTRMVCVYG